MTKLQVHHRRNGLPLVRGLAVLFILGLVLGWMSVSSWSMPGVSAQGEGTPDVEMLSAQATVQARRTQSAVQTAAAQRNGTATAARQATVDKIADDNAKTKTAIEKQEADARLTQIAVQAEQTRTAMTSVAQTVVAQATVRTMATQTAVSKTQTAEETARQVANVTATAVARKQDQEDFDAKMHNLGMVGGYVGIAVIGALILFALGVLAYRASRHTATLPEPQRYPVERIEEPMMPAVVFIEPPIIEVAQGAEAEAEAAQIVQEIASMQLSRTQGDKSNEFDARNATITVRPTKPAL